MSGRDRGEVAGQRRHLNKARGMDTLRDLRDSEKSELLGVKVLKRGYET